MEAAAERAAAGRAFAILAKGNDSLALLLELGVLLAERFALRCRLLPVPYPFCPARFEQALGVLQLRPNLLELQSGFLFESRCALYPGMPVLETGDLLEQRT